MTTTPSAVVVVVVDVGVKRRLRFWAATATNAPKVYSSNGNSYRNICCRQTGHQSAQFACTLATSAAN